MFQKLTNNPNPISIVHRLIEEIPIERYNIRVVLCLKQLHCFFLVLVQLV